MTSEGYHEPVDKLSARTLDHHRAITSLMEELEAVDWWARSTATPPATSLTSSPPQP